MDDQDQPGVYEGWDHEAAVEVTEDRQPNDRRELLKKLGRYGAYTAPAMLAILTPMKAAVPPSTPS